MPDGRRGADRPQRGDVSLLRGGLAGILAVTVATLVLAAVGLLISFVVALVY
ncbi:MAG: hypothetical protein ACR2MA_10170 [Egibacteraceae bacterium]